MKNSFEYIPKIKRKKILLICDDVRVHSGVATVAREIVIHTAHHFNWVNIAGAVKHPEKGKKLDISKDTDKNAGIKDSSIILYPVDGYGDQEILRRILDFEKPDAVMLITDPRYFRFVFQMEAEIRKNIPIAYLNIWDDYPAPLYNKAYYEACDLLMGISKQTVNINKLVLGDKGKNKIFKYVPHGLNHNLYKPIDKTNIEFINWKKNILGGLEFDFYAFFNSRNIRRKAIPDTLLGFKVFLDSLPYEEAKKCCFILHTEECTDAGTDLNAVVEYFFEEKYDGQVLIDTQKRTINELNYFYNLADVQLLLTSNEGWGLTITEAILSGTPIIANTTGGMQDQMRFIDENGKWFTPSPDVPSNHRGTYKEHGEWAFPVYPASRSIQGSPPTPYIFDDRCKWEDIADRLKEVYKLSPSERQKLGLKGREWAIGDEAGFTSKHQANRVIKAFNELFDTWKPREKYELVNVNEHKGNYLNHKIIY